MGGPVAKRGWNKEVVGGQMENVRMPNKEKVEGRMQYSPTRPPIADNAHVSQLHV